MHRVEALEPRLVLAAGPAVGINLDRVTENRPGWVFADAFLTSRPWSATAFNTVTGIETSSDAGPPVLDAHGWPLRLPTWTNAFGETVQQRLTTVLVGERYPAGVYRAEWRGTGDVVFLSGSTVTQRGDLPDGRHFALLNVPVQSTGFAALNAIRIQIRSMSETDPIRDMHVWMPDYNGQSFAGQVWRPGAPFSPFHPAYLDRLRPFGTLRFMDWANTSASTIRTWADRRTLDDAMQNGTVDNRGIALEYTVELSNELHADPWLCMPHMADDEFVRNYATLVRDTLEPGRKVYVEWSNEVWNTAAGFDAFDWVTDQLELPENAGLSRWQLVAREEKRDFDIWRDVFAATGQQGRLVRVVAGQASNSAVTEQLTRFIADLGGDFDAVALTGYVGLLDSDRLLFNGSTTGGQIARSLRDRVAGVARSFDTHQGFADTYAARFGHDVKLVTYEGGQHADGRGQSISYQQALYDAQVHPQIYEAYEDVMRAFYEARGDLFMHFSYVSQNNSFGSWGALQWQQQPTSGAPKYRAMVDAAAGLMYEPEYTIEAITAAADETGVRPATFRITRTGDKSAGHQVAYSLTGAATAADFDPLPATIDFAPGEVSKTFTVTPVDDAVLEDEEAFTIALLPQAGYEVDDLKGAASATVSDNDGATYNNLPLANPSFETGNLSGWTLVPAQNNKTAVTQGTGASGPPAARAGSYFAWGAGADGLAGQGANPAGVSQRLDLSPYAAGIDGGGATLEFSGYGTGGGVGNDWASLQILFFDAAGAPLGATATSNRADSLRTWSSLRAAAVAPVGARLVELRAMGQRGAGTNITDAGFDDLSARVGFSPLPIVELTTSDAGAAEAGQDPAVFTFTRSGPGGLDQPLVLSYTVAGNAVPGSDYDAAALPGTVTIPAGQSSVSVAVAPLDDTSPEKTERIELQLSARAAYFRGNSYTATATVADNDLPEVTVSVSGTASETDLRTATFTVRRTTTFYDAPLTVTYAIAGTATPGADYRTLSGTVTIPTGQQAVSLVVTPLDDPEIERQETIVLTLNPGASYALGPTATRTANLNSDDRPAVTVTANDPSASETGDPGQFTVTRATPILDSALTVRYVVAGSAIPGADYVPLSGSVVIPAGATSATIDLAPLDDAAAEGFESVEVQLLAAAAYVRGVGATATVFITDNEQPPLSVVSITPVPGAAVVRVVYNTDPGPLLSPAQLTVAPLNGGADVAAAAAAFDPVSNTATYRLPAALPNENYRGTLRVGDSPPQVFDLFVLRGDINGDRRVDTFDFTTLASSFGRPRPPFTSGDLNGDGVVDSFDFTILAANFGRGVPAV